jgi:hypothetical protein
MVDVLNHFEAAFTRDPEPSRDGAILVAAALLAIALLAVIGANAASGGVGIINFDQVLPYM